jgi:hypothetical protein
LLFDSFKPLEKPLKWGGGFPQGIGELNEHEHINVLTADQRFR